MLNVMQVQYYVNHLSLANYPSSSFQDILLETTKVNLMVASPESPNIATDLIVVEIFQSGQKWQTRLTDSHCQNSKRLLLKTSNYFVS